ncbi:2-oxoacid dehydrogenase acyltransferase [Ascosphaera apis ARSEF 7405]|uniref:dihydrolipoyllysine-residue succinyltransferase n=1 Tax=Ascosphaera apis ARSEF 7405 TaxID=392613 RepID=A0A162IN69_9EURO|nr:2-oxoacid dehydrogenase acyltransferase [Ascosphaera apis ARSEF 7405]
MASRLQSSSTMLRTLRTKPQQLAHFKNASSATRSLSSLRYTPSTSKSVAAAAAPRLTGLVPETSNLSRQWTLRNGLAIAQRRGYADGKPIIVKVPQMAESISEGTLTQFTKVFADPEVGDFVERDEELATIETDKIDVVVNASESGTIKAFLANIEDTVAVGQDLVEIIPGEGDGNAGASKPKDEGKEEPPKEEPPKEEPKKEEPPKEQPKQEEPPKKEEKPAAPPPKQESKPAEPKKEASAPAPAEESSTPAFGSREERRVKMSRMRLRIAERLKQSQNTAAALTTFNEVDMSALMAFRKAYKDEILKKSGIKLGFMSAFSKACTLAMRDLPAVNASIEGPNGGDTMVYRDYVDLSVAVATSKGLVTPVVRNVESMEMVGIEKAIADLGKKARDGKLTIEDMAGGTFTISNGGVFGSLMGTPIINLPQTAVLGLHAIKERPVAVNGKVEIRPMMYIALTYDHRMLDGREAVTFLVKVKEYIEDPARMLLG